MAESDLPDHVARNRAYWDEVSAPRYVESGRRSWATNKFTWGIFGVPETELKALPEDVAGMDVIELGCGTAYNRPGWRGEGLGRPASTTRPSSLARRARSRTSTTSTSRSSTVMPRRPDCPMQASTSPSASTGHRSGPIRTAGSLRPRAFCAPAAS